MAEYTSKLNLYKPDRTDTDVIVDVSLKENFEKIDEGYSAVEVDLNNVKTKVNAQGKLSTDFDNWRDLSTYIQSQVVQNPKLPNNNRLGKTKIVIPPGNFFISDTNILDNIIFRTSGLNIVGSGRDVTRIYFDPAGNNEYFFKNDDRVLQINFSDITFVGNLVKNTHFMLSTSHGGAQNYTVSRCTFIDFDRIFDLRGTNNNSEFSFWHCNFSGTIKDGVIFVGDEDTSIASDQFLDYNFYGCQFEVHYGTFINMKYGGNINVHGGSLILIESDSETATPSTLFKLRTNSHSYGVCRLLVEGVRIEFRNRNAKLIDCEWENGNIEFLNCDMECYSMISSSKNWITASFTGYNSFPVIKFDNCSLMGKHLYKYNTEGHRYVNSISYVDCRHSLMTNVNDFVIFQSYPENGFFNHGSAPSIKFSGFRVSYDIASVFDTTLNGTTHGRSVLTKKILSIKNTNGSLPNRNGSETVKLPLGSIITKVMLYCPRNAVSSGYDAMFTLSTNEATPTVLADTLPSDVWYWEGFNVQNDVWFVCDTEEKRTLILKDNNNVDQTTTKGLCLIEYI